MIADIMTNVVQNMKSNFISKQSSAVFAHFFPSRFPHFATMNIFNI